MIDLNALSDKALMKDKALAGLELLQKHIRARDLTLVLDEMLEKGVFVEMYEQSGEYFHSMLKYIVSTGEIKKPEAFFGKLIGQFPQEKNLMTVAQYYEKKGIKQGIEQGIEQGMEKVAQNLLSAGDSIEKIITVTGLSPEKIESLKTIH